MRAKRAIPALLAVLAAATVALGAREAAASEALQLAWEAPAGCPSAESVREAALRTATTDVASGPSAPLEADV
ncbi:MAG: hypothetical protein JWO86_8729, partial [Myxococcaceae bacterium]|nr:hypothetical protein [Myxococcaceae bacterium]